MKSNLKRGGITLALAALTACALSMDLTVQTVSQKAATGAMEQVANLLYGLSQAISPNQLTLCLLTAALYAGLKRWLWQRLKPGEAVLALFFAGWTLCSMAEIQAKTVQILWSNNSQAAKSVLALGGGTVLWLMLIRMADDGLNAIARRKPVVMKRPFLTPLMVIGAVWLPQVIIRYPGTMIPDTVAQIQEFFGERAYVAMNPPVHTALLGLFLNVGNALGAPEVGLFLLVLVQTVVLAVSLAYLVSLLACRGAPDALVWGLTVFFALNPIFVMFSTTAMKDSAYSIALLLFVIQTALCVIDGERFWKHGARNLLLWAVAGTLAILMRKNGLLAVTLPAVLLGVWHLAKQHELRRRVTPLICAVMIAACAAGIEGAVKSAYSVSEGSVQDIFSLPFQQVALVMRQKGVTDEERAMIDRVLDADSIAEKYDVSVVDPVKGTFRANATASDLAGFLRVWIRLVARHPGICLDALMGHMHDLFSLVVNSSDYYQRDTWGIVNGWNLGSWWQDAAGLAWVLNRCYWLVSALPGGATSGIGFYAALTLILGYLTISQRRRALWLVWLPSLLGIGMLLFAPICATRYALPFMFAAPVLLAVSCMERREKPLD